MSNLFSSYKKAKEAHYNVKKGKSSYLGSRKVLAVEEIEGMVNIIVEEKIDIVLGGQIIGAYASVLFQKVI